MDRDMSAAALVLSILSLVCCGFPFAVAALVLVIVARRREGEFNTKTIIALVFSILGLLSAVASTIYSALFYEEFVREFERAFGEAGTVRIAATRLL